MIRFCQKLFFLFLLIFFCNNFSRSQTHAIDSLRHAVTIAKNDDEKLAAVFVFCAKRHSLSADTLLRYAAMAADLSRKKNNRHDIILSDYYFINYLVKKGRQDTALSIC